MAAHELVLDCPLPHQPSAVIWINGRQATVARVGRDGQASVVEVTRGIDGEAAYLAAVVREIGECERVAILGPSSTRLALEREYVASHHRPEHLVDVEPAGPVSPDQLVERVRALAA